jgi:hypothetical protein
MALHITEVQQFGIHVILTLGKLATSRATRAGLATWKTTKMLNAYLLKEAKL